jgi:hypothetical protein
MVAKKHRHKWIQPVEIVGGCDENPGVNMSGGWVVSTYVCMSCAAEKKECDDITQQEPSEKTITHGVYDAAIRRYRARWEC